nr:retrotransposon protein, putative, Ty1-copia subclass [Tanacetum cinerariifolium]
MNNQHPLQGIERNSKPLQFYYGFLIEEDKISDSTLRELDEPANYKEAMASPEIQFMYDNQVWNLVDTTPGLKMMGYKWIFKKNIDMDGKVHIYKARLVAKGYTQTYRVNYEETFSSVAKIKSIRIMLAIVAFHNYEIWKMDVKIAFLNEKLTKDVYMAQPKGITIITVNEKRAYELKGIFLDDLRKNAFSGTNGEDAVEHIEYFLKIIDLINLPNVNYERLRLATFPIS